MNKDTKNIANSVQVEILSDKHTHKGQPCKKGDVITCSADTAKWMTKREKPIGKIVAASAAKTDTK